MREEKDPIIDHQSEDVAEPPVALAVGATPHREFEQARVDGQWWTDEPAEAPARVLLVGSNGGHLSTLAALRPWWEGHDRLWVTFDKLDARSTLVGERVVWAHDPTTRNIPNALRNLRLALTLIPRWRPTVVVSNGAGVAFPFFVVARLLGIRLVFIEASERIETPSLTGRMCYPLSDLFLVQWEEQLRMYPAARLIGRIL